MKTKTILIAAVMFFALSLAAFAQATFQVGSIPVTAVANSGQTEKTGDITFTTVSGSPATVAGTVTISYGVPITVGPGSIVITGTPAGTFSVNTINNAAGQLVLNVVGGVAAPIAAAVSGVRVATAGSTLTSLSATISTTGNALVAGQTAVTVINAISAGIASVSATSATSPATINAVTGAITGATQLNITEGFINAFGVAQADDPTQTVSTMVRITLSQAPPPGVTVTFPGFAGTQITTPPNTPVVPNAFETADAEGNLDGGNVVFANDSATLTVYYRVVTSTSPTQVERLNIPITVAVSATATKPLTAANITATATFAPIGNAFRAAGTFTPPANNVYDVTELDTLIPRYAALEVGPATILGVMSGSTTLMIPFATSFSVFDTGIAIANTTADPNNLTTPSTNLMGFTGAVKQSGTITFYFFPQVGSTFSYTTKAGSPGAGLNAGALDAGRTYSVLLSELLAAAAAPADYNGYIVAICNFTNAHGQYFISDFEAFTSGAQPLVLNTSAPTAFTGTMDLVTGAITGTMAAPGRGGPEGANP